MAVNLKKKTKESEVENHSIQVLRTKLLEDVIMFDMIINGVTIYGCSYRTLTRKDDGSTFAKIGFPSRKGKDGNYYNHVYVKLSEHDINDIELGIEAVTE